MKKLKRFCLLFIVLIKFLNFGAVNTFAVKPPVLNKLTPNLQGIVMKYAEYQKSCFKHITRSVEEIAESHVYKENVEIDGSYCYRGTHQYPLVLPKLTNEDIESLNNLKKMNDLTLSNFDLTEVDLTKFLEINTGQEMKVVCLDGCDFSQSDEEIKKLLSREGYTVGTAAGVWITWPGVDPHSIFEGR